MSAHFSSVIFLPFLHSLQQFSRMDSLSAFNVFHTLHSTEIVTHFTFLSVPLSNTHTHAGPHSIHV